MRLGAPLPHTPTDPQEWAAAVKAAGYRAAYCPVRADAGLDTIRAFERAAQEADIVIAEVGVWNNPLATDEAERQKAVAFCKTQLALADEIGARCCVNVAGSLGPRWDGPYPDDLTPEAFERIVALVREVIDEVKPRRTYYTLEPMPWMYPDSPDSYLELIRAIDRERFAVHLDPVNWISSPQRYFQSGAFVRECVEKLGPYIRSVHAKDSLLSPKLTTHLTEVRPGLGCFDYRTFLREIDCLDPDLPFLLEHLSEPEEYLQAAAYVRSVAAEVGVAL